jgi:hypothetical protein
VSPLLAVAVQIELFQRLRDAGPAGLSTDALSIRSPYHKHQLERILRHLQASSVIDFSHGVWLATDLSNEFATPHFQSSILFCHYTTRQAFNGLPEYFTRMAKEESSAVPSPFQIGMKSTEENFFLWLAANPTQASYFNHFMQAYRAGNAMWFESDFYPVSERLLDGFDFSISDVLLVDVGGGKGHDLAAFAAAHPHPPGEFILQDQASVLAEVDPSLSKLFTARPWDFFASPEPVKFARAYFLHSILHDWGDADCLRILANLKPSLKPGYSRVLFNEIVVSEEKPTLPATSMDMMMLAHCDPAYERTERAWRDLLGQAGYVIRGIYSSKGAAESVIEAEIV